MSSELRATLAISRSEALSGTSRTLTLPGGRKVTVVVPAGAYDGQVIRMEDQAYGGPPSTLLLTLAIIQAETPPAPPDPNLELPTIAASSPYAQNPSTSSPTPIPYYQNPPTITPHLYEENSFTAPPPPSTQPPLVASHITNPQQPVLPPFYAQEESITAPPPPPPGQVAPVHPAPVNGRAPFANVRAILLVGLALLVIAGGVGLFFVFRANQASTNSTSATATAQIGATVTANAFNATTTAQASSVGATSVAFNATATVQAQSSATAAVIAANSDPYGGGTLTLYDPLRDNNSGYSWSLGTTKTGGGCTFSGGSYHVSESNTSFFQYCTESNDFSNFAFEVKMQIINGDGGGIVFRFDNNKNNYYVFFVNDDGSYNLAVCTGGSCHQLFNTGSSSAIHQSLGQINVVAVVAQGSTITLYVNHQQITSVTDSTYSHGQIGLVASPFSNNGHATEVVYSNAKVWTL
jgi:hypothetical protein